MMSATLFILQMEDLICNTTHKEKMIRRSFQNGLIPEKSAVSRLTTIICLRPIRSGSDLDIFKPGSGLCPRSEERRVGKESGARRWAEPEKKKGRERNTQS